MKTKNKNKRREGIYKVPRFVAIISRMLSMHFQPNRGSSMYKLPGKKIVIPDQEEWNAPVGTIRFSDHWNCIPLNRKDCVSKNYNERVFMTTEKIPPGKWALCVNTGSGQNGIPWKVIAIFDKQNPIHSFDVVSIKAEIRIAIKSFVV
jgi:hypothetical protein